jgi:putative glutamine amidotransferase
LHLLKGFKALVLMGGADVDPHLYGQQRQPHVYGVNPEQDHFEMALVHAAIEMKLPTLAVCRGIQLVNVALGGTLIQHIGDIPGVVQHAPGKFPAGQDYALHDVDISPRTKLSKAVGATKVNVASFHHQGIDVVGKGLKVVARSADGLVEGLEHTGRDQWLIGVQWHPEDTASTDPCQQNLYDALITAAR